MLDSTVSTLGQREQNNSVSATPSWVCVCSGCAGTDSPQGAILPQLNGTSPTAYTPDMVAPASLNAASASGAALMSGTRWVSDAAQTSKTVITYSFSHSGSSYADGAGPFRASLQAFSQQDKATTKAILASIEAVCNVQFVEVADTGSQVGVVRFAYSQYPNDMGYAGYSFFPSDSPLGGDVWIGRAQAGAEWSHYRPGLILHETLHAIGLKHPFDGSVTLNTQDNTIPNSVMSYSPVAGATSGSMSIYPSEPMPLDIKALQELYGVSKVNAGNTVYDLADASVQGNFRAVYDNGGIDTFDASKVKGSVFLDLNTDTRSDVGLVVHAFAYEGAGANRKALYTAYTSTLSIAKGTVIENAVGSAFDDVIKGNSANNRLQGGAGNDTLMGGDGIDTAAYAGKRGNFSFNKKGGTLTVTDKTGLEGTDTLTGMERLSFSDRSVALDLDGNAGKVAMIVGALAGKQGVHNLGLVGDVLDMLDSGMSMDAATDAAIAATTQGAFNSSSFVNTLYLNVLNRPANASEIQQFSHMIDSGANSRADVALMAATSDQNKVQIDLVGLSQTGLEYTLSA